MGVSTFPLRTGESYGMITYYVRAALQRRWGLMCVRYQDSVPRRVGSTADTLVSRQIDPLPSKTAVLLLSLLTVNSPITVFFSPFCSPVSFDKCMRHFTTTVKTWNSSTTSASSPHLPSPSFCSQPLCPPAAQAAARLAICYTS